MVFGSVKWRTKQLMVIGVATITAIGCQKDVTEPTARGIAAGPAVPPHPHLTVIASSPDEVTATAGSTSSWNGGQSNPYLGVGIAHLAAKTWYEIKAVGQITMTPDPRYMPGEQPKYYQPAGAARVTWGDGWNNGGWTISNPVDDTTATDLVQMWGDIGGVDRAAIGAVNYNAYCGVGYADPCGNYTGNATRFTFSRLKADLELTADSTMVKPGSVATFSYHANPLQVQGKTIPVVAASIKWEPDAEADGGEATENPMEGSPSTCNDLQGKCSRSIVGSGTFTLTAWVNGKAITKSVHIQTPTLKLKVQQTTGAAGRSVTFTPSWSDGSTPSVPAWLWTPDSGTAHTASCGLGISPCVTAVWESGTMKVTVTRNGVTRTARAQATVVPCATGDSILDNPTVRRFADSLWKLSNASDTAARIERAMVVLDSAGRIVVHFKPIELIDGPCQSGLANELTNSTASHAIVLAAFHTHPAAVGEKVDCHEGGVTKIYSNQFGGPSPADWGIAKQFAEAGQPNIPNWYAFDRNKIYRYDAHNVDGGDVLQPNGKTIWVPHIPGQSHPWTNGYQSVTRNGSCLVF